MVIDGVILAGGQSQRMGTDKAHLFVEGATLLQHHIHLMCPLVATLYVAANNNAVDASTNVVVVDDGLYGFEGPLAGVLAALQQSDAEYLWLVSCDCYGLSAEILACLRDAVVDSGADIACLVVGGRRQPLLAILRQELQLSLSHYMASGARSVLRWYEGLNVVDVVFDESEFWSNINTQEDYQSLVRSVERGRRVR